MKFIGENHYDVVVAGGGVAGVAAAVQAARCGKKTVVIEKTVQLGGLATTGLVNLFVPMCNGRGVQIIKGMAAEFLQLAVRYGYDDIPQEWKNGEPGYGKTNKRLVSHFSAPIFALALCELLTNEGVDVMFDSIVTDAECADGHISSVLVFNKSGYTKIYGKIFVDTTGDGDLMHCAGVPTITRGNFHTYAAQGLTLERCKTAVEAQDVAKLYRDFYGGNATLHGKNHPEGMPLWDGTDGEQVTSYFKTNQLELLQNIKADDRKTRDVVMLPAMAQFRTTRRIDGNVALKERDAYCHKADSIGAICDFEYRDLLYEVPYGTLVCDGFDNIITAGRSACGEGWMWEALRVIPPAIITGQAAGMAAAHAIETGCAIADVQVQPLQQALAKAGVMIHFDDAWIPEDICSKETVDIGHI